MTLDRCDYLVESYFERSPPPEEDYRVDPTEWEEARCQDFLDVSRTPMVGRMLWAPKWIPSFRTWGRYCLLRRRSKL